MVKGQNKHLRRSQGDAGVGSTGSIPESRSHKRPQAPRPLWLLKRVCVGGEFTGFRAVLYLEDCPL